MTKNYFLTGIECDFDRNALKSTDCFWDPICGIYSITDNVAQKLNENVEDKDWILETIDSLVSQYPASPLEMLDEAATS